MSASLLMRADCTGDPLPATRRSIASRALKATCQVAPGGRASSIGEVDAAIGERSVAVVRTGVRGQSPKA